jgi:hypothetical protein
MKSSPFLVSFRKRLWGASLLVAYGGNSNSDGARQGRSQGNCKVLCGTAILAVKHGQDACATIESGTLQFSGAIAGKLQSPDAKGTGPCFRATVSWQKASSGRKMDQSPDFAVLLGAIGGHLNSGNARANIKGFYTGRVPQWAGMAANQLSDQGDSPRQGRLLLCHVATTSKRSC